MAKSRVSVNAKEFVQTLTKEQLKYHQENMVAISDAMDQVRMDAANKMIIPRRGPYPATTRSRYILYKRQPAVSGKLTERTGLLKRILKSPGSWTKSKTRRRLKADPHLLFWVSPQSEGNKKFYVARLSIVEKGSADVRYRIKHETRGIRGRIRKFLEPALEQNKKTFTRNLGKSLRSTFKV